MAGHAKKSTKKFQKNNLKDTIDQRKGFAKIKQRQQVKAKKKARRAADYAKASDDEAEKAKAQTDGPEKITANVMQDMTVDDFFQGGFEIPELQKPSKKSRKIREPKAKTGKRKREAGGDDEHGSELEDIASVEEHPVASDSEAGSETDDRIGAHKEDLEALATKDPDFYKYLKDNDADLLDFGDGTAQLQLSEDDEPPKKKKKGQNVDATVEEDGDNRGTYVTMAMVTRWETAMSQQHSLRAMREVVLAFRAAAHTNEEEGKAYKYTISSPDVYHKLLVMALQHIPIVLAHHLPVKENATGRVRVPTETKRYRALSPLLNSHAVSLCHLLENLSDASTLKLTLASTLPLIPYFLSFKKVLKNLAKTVIAVWSDSASTEATRVNAFLLIRKLAVVSDASLREAVLKTTYQELIKGSRSTTVHTLPGINLMKNSAVELWGLDPSLGYTTGFTYIRQLAIHLRTSITQPTKDSYKAIYNWQYTHSLDFWSRVLSTHCSTATNTTLKKPQDSPLHPLIYPLVQITIGALRLIPTPIYFPLRFHLTRSLLRISRSTQTYIPLAPSLLEILQSPELKKPPRASTLKPLDFNVSIRAPKAYMHTRVYQDGLGEQVAELLAEFFGIWCKNIAFPELAIPPSVWLKRWLKEVSSPPTPRHVKASGKHVPGKGNKNAKVNSALVLLVQKIAANAAFVEEKRRKVDFAIGDRKGVEAFLKDVEWEDMPLGAYVVGMRKRKEERERVLEEGRRAQEERREKGEGKEREGMVEGGEEMDDDAEDEEEDPAEEGASGEDEDSGPDDDHDDER